MCFFGFLLLSTDYGDNFNTVITHVIADKYIVKCWLRISIRENLQFRNVLVIVVFIKILYNTQIDI